MLINYLNQIIFQVCTPQDTSPSLGDDPKETISGYMLLLASAAPV